VAQCAANSTESTNDKYTFGVNKRCKQTLSSKIKIVLLIDRYALVMGSQYRKSKE